MPSQEAFNAMHDAAFCDWWDAWFSARQANASSEDEVEQAHSEMKAAFDRRFA